MKKITVFTSFLALAWGALQAQNDEDAKSLLSNVDAKYSELTSYSFDFTNNLYSPMAGVDEKTKGSAIISGVQFRLDMGKQLVITDGITMWTYLKDDNEVNISDFEAVDSEMNPINLHKMWENGYNYRLRDSETIDGNKYEVLELNPENKDDPYFKVNIWIDPSDYTIKKWQMFEKNGNRYTYEVTSFKVNVTTPASTFFFDKSEYPNVEQIDFRND